MRGVGYGAEQDQPEPGHDEEDGHVHGLAPLLHGCAPDTAWDDRRPLVVLAVVPMFHINGWCLPFAAALAGSTLVLPGARLDPECSRAGGR